MNVLTAILFPGGAVRLSTALGLGAFGTLALTRRDWRPLAAAVMWMLGFEAAFEITPTFGHDPRAGVFHALVWGLILGALITPWLARRGVRPARWLLLAAFAFFAVWAATGFHVNPHSGVHFDPLAEVLNETSKILWAAAYFLPLLRSGEAMPGVDAEHGVAPADLGGQSRMTVRG